MIETETPDIAAVVAAIIPEALTNSPAKCSGPSARFSDSESRTDMYAAIPPPTSDRATFSAKRSYVPLAHQVVAEMRKLRALTQHEQWLLPSDWHPDECMSTGAISGALKRMGYRGEVTGHGFRGVASTILHERVYEGAHIEAQLAHLKRSKVGAAYNCAQYLVPRTRMMQDWADYLDTQLEIARNQHG